MTEKIYTLTQRRMRDALHRIRDFESLKEWIDQNVVGPPVTVSDWSPKTLDERRVELDKRAVSEWLACLQRGFTFDGGVFPASGSKRQRVVEHAARINAYKNGDAAAPLPNGKTTLQFVDVEGGAHDLDSARIIELAETGDDLADAADTRLEEIRGAIKQATSHEDLDAIDVASGWPN